MSLNQSQSGLKKLTLYARDFIFGYLGYITSLSMLAKPDAANRMPQSASSLDGYDNLARACCHKIAPIRAPFVLSRRTASG
jgi:hypothetical protein